MKVRILAVLAAVAVLVPVLAFAESPTIADLLQQIAKMQEQLNEIRRNVLPTETPAIIQPSVPVPVPVPSFCYEFKKNLRLGEKSGDVNALQSVLQMEGFQIPGSEMELGEYGEGTASAVTGFQQKYASEILSPVGLKFGNGFFGANTRAKMNRLYNCKPSNEPSIHISAGKGYIVGSGDAINIAVGQTIRISGEPQGLKGLKYERAWFFDDVFSGVCSNNGATDPEWWLECVPKKTGSTEVYVEIYAKGTIYRSNTVTVNVRERVINDSLVTLLSPNGGETWYSGTTQYFRWQDNTPIPACIQGPACVYPIPKYDIYLEPYPSQCSGNTCRAYVLATGLTGPAYGWSVGKGQYGTIIPTGSYIAQVCREGGACDSSNSYFKIVSQGVSNPVINGISGPTILEVGQQGTWKVTASDPGNGALSYSVYWGDLAGGGTGTGSSVSLQPQQTATFTHAYSARGTYSPRFVVTNSSGRSAETSLSVVVGGAETTPTFKIADTIGIQSLYRAGQDIVISLSGAESDGTWATSEEGFNVQAYVYNSARTDYSSWGNGSYNAATGRWQVTLKAPTDTSVKYSLRVNLYCSRPGSVCDIKYGQKGADGNNIYYDFQVALAASVYSDSDNSPDYTGVGTGSITPQTHPDLFVKGVSKGNYVGASEGSHWVFGDGSSPPSPQARPSTDGYTTYFDHCANESQLNEGYLIKSTGKMGAVGVSAPAGYLCSNGAFVPKPRLAIVASDSDNSPDYMTTSVGSITPQTRPDLFVRGISKGIYAGSSEDNHLIFGDGGSPPSPEVRPSLDPYTHYFDHCPSEGQLNEGYIVKSSGKIGAHGITAPAGYLCSNGAFVPKPTEQSTVVITSPTEGQNWAIGTKQVIAWTTRGMASGSGYIDMVGSNGTSYRVGYISSGASGNYTWTVGLTADGRAVPPGIYSLKVIVNGIGDIAGPLNITNTSVSGEEAASLASALQSMQEILEGMKRLFR